VRKQEYGRTHLGNDTVEGGVGITESVLASCQLTEVLCCLRDNVVVELEDDASSRLLVNGYVELYVRQRSGTVGPRAEC